MGVGSVEIAMNTPENLTPRLTADGSFTFFSSTFKECFHSTHGAWQEAQLKFVQPTQLAQKATQPRVRLLDVCYGLGYNTAAALALIWSVNPACQVELIALESEPTVPKAAIAAGFFSDWPPRVQAVAKTLAVQPRIDTQSLQAMLWLGDARQTIQQLEQSSFRADAIFLDPFSPPRCPQLWTVEFLKWVAKALAPEGRIATYSCAAAVRTALLSTGLHIGSTPPVGRRSPGTVASFTPLDLPLSLQEQEHLHTQAAIPYRDPELRDSAQQILLRRQVEQQESSLERTGSWKRRWFLTPGRSSG